MTEDRTPTEELTPETRALLDGLAALGLPPLHTQTPEGARAMREEVAELAGAPVVEPVAVVSDGTIAGPGGPLAVRFYQPEGWEPGAGSVAYFHGGGWVLGDLETHDGLCRGLANRSGLRVMATDYRRAPESPHPAALEDAWAATEWLRAEEEGPLVLGGDSCGGHIATIVAARARGTELGVSAQLLIYPVTDLSRFDTESYARYADGYWLTKASMGWFRGHYLPADADPAEPDVSPLLRDDLQGMPPAVVVAAACDVLLDEGRAYADRLIDAGCPVEYRRYDDVIHGFAAMPGVIPEGRDALAWAGAALRRALEAAP
jgi:acetyl esterase